MVAPVTLKVAFAASTNTSSVCAMKVTVPVVAPAAIVIVWPLFKVNTRVPPTGAVLTVAVMVTFAPSAIVAGPVRVTVVSSTVSVTATTCVSVVIKFS